METQKLKVLIEAGAVREAEALPDGEGWAVWIVHATRGGERREALERQRGGVRVFATLDAVARCLAGAGLSAFRVSVAGLPGTAAKPP
ncbi:MAG: hypothetical protein V9G98_01780 [Candidatus Competibacter sp.]